MAVYIYSGSRRQTYVRTYVCWGRPAGTQSRLVGRTPVCEEGCAHPLPGLPAAAVGAAQHATLQAKQLTASELTGCRGASAFLILQRQCKMSCAKSLRKRKRRPSPLAHSFYSKKPMIVDGKPLAALQAGAWTRVVSHRLMYERGHRCITQLYSAEDCRPA